MKRSACILSTLGLLAILPAPGQTLPAVRGLPAGVLAEMRAPGRPPAGSYAFVRAWEVEGAACRHGTGRRVEDPGASGGAAWEARPGRDAAGACLVFGPYLQTPAGDYAAFFRIRLLEPCDELLGSLDACMDRGQSVLARRTLKPAGLAAGKYVLVPLFFRALHAGELECRVHWAGAAGLRVDKVLLYKVSGVKAGAWGRAPAARPSGRPANLVPVVEKRPFPEVFPKSAPPAGELLACDIRGERPDMRLLLFCLQGLINRSRPRLYLITNEQDRFWLAHLKRRGWIQKIRPATAPELLNRFRGVYKGLVLFDPLFLATRNAATMLAAVDDLLPASPRLAGKLGLPAAVDLRGRWRSNAEVYRWAFEHLWPKLNHHVIACLWPDHLALRDYLVQNRVFIFWLSGPLDGAEEYASPQAEVETAEKFLARMPANIPVMGYPWAGKDVGIGEGPGVGLFAEFGKYLVGSIDCANLSVHSGIRIAALRQSPAPPAPKLDPAKVYFSFIVSDGDNLPVLMYHNFPDKTYWRSRVRGRLPLGWTLSPAARILIPDIVDWYYRTATPADAFLAAVSGIGYTYPDLYGKRFRAPYRSQAFDGFLEQTARAMAASDLREIWIMNASRESLFQRYAERIPGLDALFPDYGKRVSNYSEATFPTARNVPVFRAVTSCAGMRRAPSDAEKARLLAAEVRAMTPEQRPAFLHVFVLNWFATLPALQAAARRLGPDYVCVRPDHLAALFREELRRRKVWIRAPEAVACLGGRPVQFSATVQNVLDQPLSCELRTQGLDGARTAPRLARLMPGRAVEVRVAGRPIAASAGLEVQGDFGVRRARVRILRVAKSELLGVLPAGVRFVPIAWDEAENRSHITGTRTVLPGAFGGAAWAAFPGKNRGGKTEAPPPGHMVFGPYRPLPPGRYLALFRVRRLASAPAGATAATLDACVAGGKLQTGRRRLRVADLPANQWRWVPLEFKHPGGAYETRVYWPGGVALAVDAIALWRMEK